MNLNWMVRRLKAMGPEEVVHRFVRAGVDRLERHRLKMGWSPLPQEAVKPGFSLFPKSAGNWHLLWGQKFALEEAALEAFLAGRMDVFGHQGLPVGSPVQWHRDPLTDTALPTGHGKSIDYRDERLVGDIKVVWELGRHQFLVPLAIAWLHTGNPRYYRALGANINSWLKENPFGKGVHWCSALELALRLISWSVVHSLLQLGGNPGGIFALAEDPARLGQSIFQQAWFIRHNLSLHSSANNHLIGELTGLWTAARVFFLGQTGNAWARFAQLGLEQEAERQIYPDGVDKEQAFYYHLWVLEYLLFANLVGERSGEPFSARFQEKILRMARFLRDMQPPGGLPPNIGDADDGTVLRFSLQETESPFIEVLAAEAAVRGEAGFAERFQKAFWYRLMAGEAPGKPLSEPPPSQRPYPRIYRHGGYAALGDGRIHLVFDAGPLGYTSIAAHGHADALSICLAMDGQWWLVDPGTFAYHTLPDWRNYFRSTPAHNTLTIDGRNQSRMEGPFLWSRHARARIEDQGSSPQCQWVRGVHDGYQDLGIEHFREVRVYPEEQKLDICDGLKGSGEHGLGLHFHFAPDVSLQRQGEHHWLASKESSPWQLHLRVDNALQWHLAKGETEPILGWFSATLGHKESVYTLAGSRKGRLPDRRINTCLSFVRRGASGSAFKPICPVSSIE